MPTNTKEIDEVRRQMALIRRELHEDVKEVVANANAAADWRTYLTAYPWATIGLAASLGYLIVPRKSKSTETDSSSGAERISRPAGDPILAAESQSAPPEGSKEHGLIKGAITAGLGMLTPLLVRAAQGYALQYFEQWLLQQQQQVQVERKSIAALPTTLSLWT